MQHKNIVSEKQGTLSFFLPRPYTSEEFRDACSRWMCHDERLQSFDPVQIKRLFHHDADKRPSDGLAPFRFDADTYWGHVYAIGDINTMLLEQIAKVLAKTPFPTPWMGAPKWIEAVVAAAPDETVISYWMPQVVVCKNAEQHHIWKKADEHSRSTHVQDVIRRGIERQMTLLLPKLSHFTSIDAPDIRLIARERAVPRLHNRQANAYVRVASVAFQLPLRLDGHWAVGGLVSRGYGRILPFLQ